MLHNKFPADRDSSSHWSSCLEHDEQPVSSHELRKKTKEIHKLLSERSRNKSRQKKIMDENSNSIKSELKHSSCVQSVVSEDDPNSELLDTSSKSKERPERERQFKQITFKPNYRNLTGDETCGVDICKKLFGITIFEYSNGKSRVNNMTKDRKLVVQGVVDGFDSHSSRNIHRGDMLVRINDVSVSWVNFSKLLTTLKKREKVKLTFQSPRIVGPKSSYTVLQIPEADLCQALLGKRLSHVQSQLSQFHCAAMFLTLVPSEDMANDMEDVIYAFPLVEEKFLSLRGLFITLSSSLVDVVGQPALCSHLKLDNGSVNVVYRQCGKDVLVLAMPEDRISLKSLSSLMDGLNSLLVVLYADLKRAFNECERTWLDKLLAVMFHQWLGLQSALAPPTPPPVAPGDTPLYHMVKALTLANDNKLICDEILSEMESMDFDDYLEQKDLFSRRKYTVNGTCLFYKDYLACSHLSEELQRDVNLFVNCHGLLVLSARQHVDQVMVWQELKAWSGRTPKEASTVGYTPTPSRCFLMIVGLRHYYLAVVLEAGGCSGWAQGQGRPQPVMVDQAKATLGQLETQEVHMGICCQDSLNNTSSSVSLACADHFVSSISTPRNRVTSRGNHRSPLTPTKSSDSLYRGRSKSRDRQQDNRIVHDEDKSDEAFLNRRQGSKLSYGSNDSGGSGSSAGPPKSKSSRMSSMPDLSGITRSMSVLNIEAPYDLDRGDRLARGLDNSLFNYIHMDQGEGLIICPTDADMREVHSSLQGEISQNFCKSCQKMRSKFTSERSRGHREAVQEQGCLFTVALPSSEKRRSSNLCYWVVGRRWQSPRAQEMYVCFHESADQSLVEMAFSLGFGT